MSDQNPIIIHFNEKKLNYNNFLKILKDELDDITYNTIINVFDANDIKERVFNERKSDSYFKKISAEIFANLKEEKLKDPKAFNEKYQNKSMLAIRNKIWTEKYKNNKQTKYGN